MFLPRINLNSHDRLCVSPVVSVDNDARRRCRCVTASMLVRSSLARFTLFLIFYRCPFKAHDACDAIICRFRCTGTLSSATSQVLEPLCKSIDGLWLGTSLGMLRGFIWSCSVDPDSFRLIDRDCVVRVHVVCLSLTHRMICRGRPRALFMLYWNVDNHDGTLSATRPSVNVDDSLSSCWRRSRDLPSSRCFVRVPNERIPCGMC